MTNADLALTVLGVLVGFPIGWMLAFLENKLKEAKSRD